MKEINPNSVNEILNECARKIVQPYFGKLSKDQIKRKKDDSLVTEIDIKAEEFLKTYLKDFLPGSVTVGEEEAEDNIRILSRLDKASPVWIIDAVDGTKNYISGNVNYTMLVSLYQNNEIIGGWLYAPELRRQIWALKGQGTWEGNKALVTSKIKSKLFSLTGSIGVHLRKDEAIKGLFRGIFNVGCCGLEYIKIASSEIDFAHFRRVKPWDHAAGYIVIKEAGGVSRELGGGDYKLTVTPENGLLVTSNEYLYNCVEKKLLSVLNN